MGKDKGWILLYRSVRDCDFWNDKPFSRAQAWIDMLLMAYHKPKDILRGNDWITIKRGSFRTSEVELSDRWGWGRKGTRGFLKMLETGGMIDIKGDSRGTTISIVNYSKFQDGGTAEDTTKEQQRNSRGTTEDTQTNNIKNEKNEEQYNMHPTIQEVNAYIKEKGYEDVDAEYFVNYYSERNWIRKNGSPVRDWKRCVDTWHGNSYSCKTDKGVNRVDGQRSNYSKIEDETFG